ncbi:MAG: hypothetical protein CVV44_04715 [Spirochaetae bacterium HGW-Spirochaetae-1]|jgi:PAS domain S-box-containing protein|nr:MAG: hypothetical protein CVV44_04715 [Spirochaetae bacterium HGW-Spirochaetae-1]
MEKKEKDNRARRIRNITNNLDAEELIPGHKDNIEEQLSIVFDALESTINGVVIAGMEGLIVYVNPAFVRMFEYGYRQELLNKSASDLFADGKVKSLRDVEKIIDTAEGESEEFLVHRKDGSTFHVEVSTSAVRNTDGKTVGMMASFVDISVRKSAEMENKRLSSQIFKSQEIERERVARDLHDSIAQTIYAAKINFIAFQKDPVKYRDRFEVGIDFLDKVSHELREVCDDLYPSLLKDHGLESTIRWYVKNYLQVSATDVSLSIDFKSRLSRDLEVNLYRIIREIFSNIIKHAGARKVELSLIEADSVVRLRISDDGAGFSIQDVGRRGGFGLSNIRQRVRDFDGRLEIESSPGKGTTISIEIGVQ